MSITKIVSGGQTGADRGGWEAAIHCELPYGGWIPRNRNAEDRRIPDKYEGLQETKTADYLPRTEANVVDSDKTVIFTHGELTGGSLKTAEFARKHKRPWLHINLEKLKRNECVDLIVKWLNETKPDDCVLNVAGSRGSKAPGIEQTVMARMIDVITKANGTLFYPIQEGLIMPTMKRKAGQPGEYPVGDGE